MKRALLLGAAALVFAPRPAAAERPVAREGASLMPPGAWSIGLLSPARLGLSETLELDTQALSWLLLSPNAEVRLKLGGAGSWLFASTYGLSLPTGAMRLTQGVLFPTSETSGQRPAWVLVPSLGVLASSGPRDAAALVTFHLETAFGVPLGERTTPTLETYAPVELLFAPALTGLRTRAGANGSHALGTVVRARVLAEALTMGRRTDVARSPLVFHGALALEFAIGRRIAVELSGHVYESDQHRTRLVDAGDGTVRRERVRSVDVFPSLDVIVRGP